MTSIWAAWAACKNLPSAHTVMEIRSRRMSSMETIDPGTPEPKDVIAHLAGRSMDQARLFARTFMLAAFKPLFVGGDVSMDVISELRTHYVHGMSQPGKNSGSARSSQLNSGYIPNPTLLDVKNWEYCEPIPSSPFNSFSPIDSSSLNRNRSVYQSCMDILREQLSAFRFWSKLGKLSFSLYCGDPLVLSLHPLFCYSTGGRQEAGTRSGKKPGSLVQFDVIDASTLVDSVGVLNVLLCCGSLLHV